MPFLDTKGLQRYTTKFLNLLTSYVPATRTINGQSLSSDVNLTMGDIEGLTDELDALRNASGGGSVSFNVAPGVIMIWSGTEDSIPDGWHVCNGEDGTVDLRDKFVLGAGSNHPAGDTGGSEEVTLTVEQMPTHSHAYDKLTEPWKWVSPNTSVSANDAAFGIMNTSINTTQAGSSKPHSNMPPYYSLLYIQKMASQYPENLDDASWEDISRWSKEGTLKDYYKVGDSKTIMIGGNFLGSFISPIEIKLTIAGFDHNIALETSGEHCTHFLIGMRENVFCYLGGIAMTNSASGPTSGGWRDCPAREAMRNSTNGLVSILPDDLQKVMRIAKKYTNNVAGGAGASESNISYTEDNFAILSLYEMFGVTTYIDPNEAIFQAQYELFSRLYPTYQDKHFLTEGANGQNFIWTRSPVINTNTSYGAWVNGQTTVTTGNGVVPAAAPIVIFV